MDRTHSDFEVVMTTDGSPSLRIQDCNGYVEEMHHTAGALSESIYIYGEAIAMVLDRGWHLHALSLGLGLGYNEMLVAHAALKRNLDVAEVRLYSFESESVLTREFVQWLSNEENKLTPLYQSVARQLEAMSNLSQGQIRQWLNTARVAGSFSIRGRFPETNQGIEGISCVLYDAFSNKMCPELWSEAVIIETANLCAPKSVFATYAATGNLNRALKRAGFKRQARRGFAGRRESTLAIRGDTL